MIICLNGRFVPENKALISVLDNGFQFGDGFYDTMRTYGDNILELDLHLDRVANGARVLGIEIPWAREELRKWTTETVRRNRIKDARIRITISRGVNGFDFTTSKHPTLAITCEKIVINPAHYEKGVSVSTMKMQRLLPEIKTLGLTSMIVAYRKAAETKDYEMILVGEKNMVREGASTSVFIVRHGVLYTPARHILHGLTRKRIIAIARRLKLKVIVRDFSVRTLIHADEVFLTNRPREVIPVIRCNGQKIGNGRPGPVTKTVMNAYREYVREQAGRG